jgi:glycosyltransferase involved in cell wall biosynthesis
MTKPYSLDLRDRAAARVAAGETVRSVAATFRVGVSSVVKWSQRLSCDGQRSGQGGGPSTARSDWRNPLTTRCVVACTRGLATASSQCRNWALRSSRLRKEPPSRDVIRFIGRVPDAHQLMCAGDIFLLSSDHEEMPNVVLEAMPTGVPCVATRVNSIGDLIQHGVTGFVAARNVADLAQHVLQLAADAGLRCEVGARARAAVERGYQPEQVLRQLGALCE